MAVASKIVTYEEWLTMPEVEDAIEEVVDGELRIMPPPKWKHARIVERLARLLRAQVNEDETLIAISQFGLVIRRSPFTSRVPDLALFVAAHVVEQDGYVHSPPELAVEVLSPANNRAERAGKLADYAALGVPEVWVLSPEARTVEILHLAGGKLETHSVLREGKITPRMFPHVAVDIAAVWP